MPLRCRESREKSWSRLADSNPRARKQAGDATNWTTRPQFAIYSLPSLLPAPFSPTPLRPCRHRGKHLICRSPALRCLPEMGGWPLAADGCWLTATASCCLLTAGCWQRTATRCSSTTPLPLTCRWLAVCCLTERAVLFLPVANHLPLSSLPDACCDALRRNPKCTSALPLARCCCLIERAVLFGPWRTISLSPPSPTRAVMLSDETPNAPLPLARGLLSGRTRCAVARGEPSPSLLPSQPCCDALRRNPKCTSAAGSLFAV